MSNLSSFHLHDRGTARPALISSPKANSRLRIWETPPVVHCSIIGTCFTAAELRRLFVKFKDPDGKTATDHALHGRAVRIAGQHDLAAKLLHKALDKRHEIAVRRFSKAANAAELRTLWNQAFEQGDIPGAYWAVLTHPATDHALVQEVFGEIHMLSHMVGSSSRIDIARLRRLEIELGKRDDTIADQQVRLQAAAQERTLLQQKLDKLEAELARRRLPEIVLPAPEADGTAALRQKLEDERAYAAALARRLQDTSQQLEASKEAIAEIEAREVFLQKELAHLERELDATDQKDDHPTDFGGKALLYVGGRPGQIVRLRAIAKRHGGELLTHDGGVEDNAALLPGLISRAAVALFPVDCTSHGAAGQVKRLCRAAGKPYVPLRNSGLASFVAAIQSDTLFECNDSDS